MHRCRTGAAGLDVIEPPRRRISSPATGAPSKSEKLFAEIAAIAVKAKGASVSHL
jgi:hypothetical protein